MLVDFQADGTWPMVNYKVKRAEKGSARAAEQVFWTRELMLFGPVAKSVSSIARNFFPFQLQKPQHSGAVGYNWEGFGTEREGLGTQDFEANTKLMHSAFSWVELAVVPLEVRKGVEGGAYTRDQLDKTSPSFIGRERHLKGHSWDWIDVVFWLSWG